MKISFVGDICVNGSFGLALDQNRSIISNEIKNVLYNNDCVVSNLEGPVSEKPFVNAEVPNVKSHINTIKALSENYIDILNLANNHIFDCGEIGLEDSILHIDKENLEYFGIGDRTDPESLIFNIQKRDVTVALISLSEYKGNAPGGFAQSGILLKKELELLRKAIKIAREKATWVILNYHGGEEFSFYPFPPKRGFLQYLTKNMDIDIIIGHHSHTFQGIEKLNGTTIFYSLGNFIFDYKSHSLFDLTDESCIVEFEFGEKNFTYKLIPVKINTVVGLVEKGEGIFIDFIHEISNFKGYREKWKREAYRILFERKKNNNTTGKEGLQQRKMLSLFFSFSFYKKLLVVFASSHYFYLYTGALFYKYFKLRRKIRND